MSNSLPIYSQIPRKHGEVLHKGNALCIVIVKPEGVEARDRAFRHALPKPNIEARALNLLRRLGEDGKISNRELFTNEGDNCWAVKPTNKIRLYGWYCKLRQGDFVIGHAAFKNQRKMDPKDKQRMEVVREAYEAREYGDKNENRSNHR